MIWRISFSAAAAFSLARCKRESRYSWVISSSESLNELEPESLSESLSESEVVEASELDSDSDSEVF